MMKKQQQLASPHEIITHVIEKKKLFFSASKIVYDLWPTNQLLFTCCFFICHRIITEIDLIIIVEGNHINFMSLRIINQSIYNTGILLFFNSSSNLSLFFPTRQCTIHIIELLSVCYFISTLFCLPERQQASSTIIIIYYDHGSTCAYLLIQIIFCRYLASIENSSMKFLADFCKLVYKMDTFSGCLGKT